MSKAKIHSDTVHASASPCSSRNGRISTNGGPTTPLGSNTLCSTSNSSATATNSGESSPDSTAASPPSLSTRVNDERYPARVAALAAQIPAAGDQQTVHRLFREGVAALGAGCAVFVSFVRNDTDVSACRFMLACDPAWGRTYIDGGHFVHDPWLAYAAHHSEPIPASALTILDAEHQRVLDLASRHGFVSTVLVPAHSGAGHSRISLLCLGSSIAGYFEDDGLPRLRVSARMLAMELHDWWLSRIRRELILKARISRSDLILLQHQCQGHSSKKIASELQVSKSSINSRFQRMNAKLGVANRRSALHLAIECGLVLK